MSGYGDKSKVNVADADVIASLSPGIYTEGHLVDIRKHQAGKDDDKKEVLIFGFADKNGERHDHTEWDQSGDSVKETNQLSRIGSFLRQVNENFEFEFEKLNSWDDVRTQAIEAIKGIDLSSIPLDFKIVGNVYSPKKPKAIIPNYKGAVVASSKKVKLAFSAQEIEDNITYKAILSGERKFDDLPPLPQDDTPLDPNNGGIGGEDNLGSAFLGGEAEAGVVF